MKDYMLFTRSTAIYPTEQALTYLTLGLASEAGEVAGKLKKHIREGEEMGDAFLSEVGDVLWYIARICDEMNITMEELAQKNMDKLSSRLARNTLKGNGDTR